MTRCLKTQINFNTRSRTRSDQPGVGRNKRKTKKGMMRVNSKRPWSKSPLAHPCSLTEETRRDPKDRERASFLNTRGERAMDQKGETRVHEAPRGGDASKLIMKENLSKEGG